MRRFYAISLSFFLLAGLFLGCSRQAPKTEDETKQPVVKIELPIKGQGDDPKKKNGDTPPKQDDEKEEKYQEALGEALRAVAQRNWSDALTAYEAARSFNDTEFVQS